MTYQPTDLLTVYLDARNRRRKVGRVALRDRRILFEYDPTFIASGIEISPIKLPLKTGVQVADTAIFDGLLGVFNDSLPDGWGRLCSTAAWNGTVSIAASSRRSTASLMSAGMVWGHSAMSPNALSSLPMTRRWHSTDWQRNRPLCSRVSMKKCSMSCCASMAPPPVCGQDRGTGERQQEKDRSRRAEIAARLHPLDDQVPVIAGREGHRRDGICL